MLDAFPHAVPLEPQDAEGLNGKAITFEVVAGATGSLVYAAEGTVVVYQHGGDLTGLHTIRLDLVELHNEGPKIRQCYLDAEAARQIRARPNGLFLRLKDPLPWKDQQEET